MPPSKSAQIEKLVGRPVDEYLHAAYEDQRLSQSEIASQLSVSQVLISQLMKKFGIIRRPFRESQNQSIQKRKSSGDFQSGRISIIPELEEKIGMPMAAYLKIEYCEKKRPPSDIATQLGVSSAAVKKWVRKYGLPARSHQEAMDNQEEIKIANFEETYGQPIKTILEQAYYEEKFTLKEISKMLGISQSYCNKLFEMYEINKRTEEETLSLISSTHKRLWANPKYREEMLKRQGRNPSRAEISFGEVLPESFRHTGKGDFWIELSNGKFRCPDFVVEPFDQSRTVIEFFGNYWHTKDEEAKAIDDYAAIGIKCIVVWEKEFKKNPHFVIDDLCSQLFDYWK